MIERKILSEVSERIKKAARILVVSHQRPDADAYGSSLGLTLALRSLGKTAACINESGSIARYFPIPGVKEVLDKIPEGAWDLCVVCDCGALNRVGDSFLKKIPAIAELINIDHHISNDKFGALNLVDEEASSTSEIVYHLLTTLGASFTADIATCLLSGIIGDTGSFRYDSTKAETFRLAEQLTMYGASSYKISRDLFSAQSLNAVKFQAAALLSIEQYGDGKIAEIVVPAKMYKEYGVDCEDADVLVERARDIEGIELAALMREDNGIWRVSLRAKTPAHDVAAVASSFGGGGHRAAAGFRWKKGIEELRSKLREALLSLL
jgi:phosphoesterase RecJ-like protein